MLDAPPEVPRDQYDGINAVNWSRLRLLEKSPTHYRIGLGEDSSGFTLGTAAHMAILEPARFANEYVVTDIRRDARTRKWQEFEEECLKAGKQILIRSEYDRTIAIRDKVRENKRAMHYLSDGKPEQTLRWKLGDYDCKGRADYIGPRAIVDLKSTKCSEPRAFARSCRAYGYFGQAAWYSDGLTLSGLARRPFVFVAVESAPPHLVTVFTVPEHVLAEGREQYLGLMGKLDYCTKRNWWGGYVEAEEVALELPPDWRTAAPTEDAAPF
jgi:hypothetical protein